MEKLPMCRVCLAQNVRMYVVVNENLRELYEKLTDNPFVTEDSRPILACFFCCTKLKQCCQFQRKCLEAEELFARMMSEDYEPKPLPPEFYNGFIQSPVVHISIVGECQTESIVIKEELPAVCERLDDIVEPKEECQSDELELENQENSFSCVKDIPADSDDDDEPLKEFKIDVEEHEVLRIKRRASDTQDKSKHDINILSPRKTRSKNKPATTIALRPRYKIPYVPTDTSKDEILVMSMNNKNRDKTYTPTKGDCFDDTADLDSDMNTNIETTIHDVNSNETYAPNEDVYLNSTAGIDFDENSNKETSTNDKIRNVLNEDDCITAIAGIGLEMINTLDNFINDKNMERIYIPTAHDYKNVPTEYYSDCPTTFTQQMSDSSFQTTTNILADDSANSFIQNSHMMQSTQVHGDVYIPPSETDESYNFTNNNTKYSEAIPSTSYEQTTTTAPAEPAAISLSPRANCVPRSDILNSPSGTISEYDDSDRDDTFYPTTKESSSDSSDSEDVDSSSDTEHQIHPQRDGFERHQDLAIINEEEDTVNATKTPKMPRIRSAPVVKKPKLEDVRAEEQKKNEQSDTKVIRTTENCTFNTVTKFKEPLTDTKGVDKSNKVTVTDIIKRHRSQRVKDKSFKCEICQRSFSEKRLLTSHIRTHTGEKPFKCKVCQRCFSDTSNLTRHIRIHTGEMPFKCDVCQRCFREKRSLKCHIRTHTGERPYKCDVCQSNFRQNCAFTRHIREKHPGEKPYK